MKRHILSVPQKIAMVGIARVLGMDALRHTACTRLAVWCGIGLATGSFPQAIRVFTVGTFCIVYMLIYLHIIVKCTSSIHLDSIICTVYAGPTYHVSCTGGDVRSPSSFCSSAGIRYRAFMLLHTHWQGAFMCISSMTTGHSNVTCNMSPCC